jgi:adenylate kinase
MKQVLLKKKIVFLGPPGSGKGTQAQLLSKNFSIPHISTGDIFRKIIKTGKPKKLADSIKKYVQSGLLVPDDIVFKSLFSVIKNKKYYILDGFPRNINQAKLLDEALKKDGIDKVIYFKVSDKEIIKRLTSRRTCPKCGRVYNIYTLKPKNDNLCDVCKVELIIRDDDKLETVKKRLEVYKKDTLPLLDYYKKKKLLVTINAEDKIENVYKKMCDVLLNEH